MACRERVPLLRAKVLIDFGSFSHKCQPMTVKEPGKSSIQIRIQRQPTTRVTLKRSHRRNLDVNGVVGVSATPDNTHNISAESYSVLRHGVCQSVIFPNLIAYSESLSLM